MGRYCSYLLPKQGGWTPQIKVNKTQSTRTWDALYNHDFPKGYDQLRPHSLVITHRDPFLAALDFSLSSWPPEPDLLAVAAEVAVAVAAEAPGCCFRLAAVGVDSLSPMTVRGRTDGKSQVRQCLFSWFIGQPGAKISCTKLKHCLKWDFPSALVRGVMSEWSIRRPSSWSLFTDSPSFKQNKKTH